MSQSASDPTAANWAAIMFVGLLWGTAFMSTKVALGGIAPTTLAALRVAVGAAALVACALATGRRFPGFRSREHRLVWLFAALIGVVSVAVPFWLLSWGQQHVSSAFAGISMATVPLIVAPLSTLFVAGQTLTLLKSAGIAAGFAGVAMLVGIDSLFGSGKSQELAGQLACIGAACGYAAGSIMTREAPKASMLMFAAMTISFAALALVPAALAIDGLPRVPLDISGLALLHLALGPTALAAFLRVHVVKTAGPTFMSYTSYMVPVWSVVFGWTFLGEDLPPQLLLALVFILGGIAMAQAPAGNRRP